MGRKIYLLRHGKPFLEDGEKRCIGITDVVLSREGKRQAEKIGRWLQKENIVRIYSSPLKRCVQSAEIVYRYCQISDRNAGVLFDNRIHIYEELHEMKTGEWENLCFSEIKKKYPGEFEKRGCDIGYYAPPGGESFYEAGVRFGKCLRNIQTENAMQKGNLLIVAHAGVIRGFLCSLLGLSYDHVFDLPQPEAGVTVLEESDVLSVRQIGWRPPGFLDSREICHIYEKCQVPEQVIRHMRAVADYVDEMDKRLRLPSQEKELLKKAALVHDIFRVKSHHAKLGAEFLYREGYPEIAELVRCHHGEGFPEADHRLPKEKKESAVTLAELLFYADKRVHDDRIVSLDERFEESRIKCLSPKALQAHRKQYELAKYIERKIENVYSSPQVQDFAFVQWLNRNKCAGGR